MLKHVDAEFYKRKGEHDWLELRIEWTDHANREETSHVLAHYMKEVEVSRKLIDCSKK